MNVIEHFESGCKIESMSMKLYKRMMNGIAYVDELKYCEITELVHLAKIGQATKQYVKEYAEALNSGNNTGDFEPCVDVAFFEEICEGCKLYEICELMKEDKHGQST